MPNPLLVGMCAIVEGFEESQILSEDVVPYMFRKGVYIYYCPLDFRYYQSCRQIATKHHLSRHVVLDRCRNKVGSWKRLKISGIASEDLIRLKVVRLRWVLNADGSHVQGNSTA